MLGRKGVMLNSGKINNTVFNNNFIDLNLISFFEVNNGQLKKYRKVSQNSRNFTEKLFIQE